MLPIKKKTMVICEHLKLLREKPNNMQNQKLWMIKTIPKKRGWSFRSFRCPENMPDSMGHLLGCPTFLIKSDVSTDQILQQDEQGKNQPFVGFTEKSEKWRIWMVLTKNCPQNRSNRMINGLHLIAKRIQENL